MGPSGRFHSYIVTLDCLGQVCIWVELPVQRRLCPIFVRDVGSIDIHEFFRGLTGSQRTPGRWGVTAPSTYAPPTSPHFTSTPQAQQPPQLRSSVEQAILNLSKLVDNFKEEQRAVNVQANKKINTVESSLNKELDGF